MDTYFCVNAPLGGIENISGYNIYMVFVDILNAIDDGTFKAIKVPVTRFFRSV